MYIIYNKPTRCNSGSIVFIKNYKYALTCFGRPLRPSSGALQTVPAATGVCHAVMYKVTYITLVYT